MRPRIRSIKPEAHTDEKLWDLEQETGLPLFRAFTGLWNWSDREGRFEWRVRPLKAGILPYWDGDFGDVLEALRGAGFIQRYSVDGKEYGLVRKFTEHQQINNREEQSSLPAPPKGSDSENSDVSASREARDTDAQGTREARVGDAPRGEWNGRERKGREGSTGEAPVDQAPTHPGYPEEEIPTFDPDPSQVHCPAEPLPEKARSFMAKSLGVSELAVAEGIREFVEFWTIGGGAGRRKSKTKWMADCREDLRRKQKLGKLVEPAAASSSATPAETPEQKARRKAVQAERDEAERQRKREEAIANGDLLPNGDIPGGFSMKQLLKGVG